MIGYSAPRCRVTGAFVFLSVAFGLAGCGAPTGSVSGVVTYNGKPVEKATVAFTPPNGQTLEATSGPDGGYSLSPVPVGVSRVLVVAVSEDYVKMREGQADGGKERVKKDAGSQPLKYSTVPEKYAKSATSPLQFDVQRGKNKYDIPLTD